ncbi:hypothetical protein ACQEV9_31250 [Streptomyces chartreusis]|uniref:hypothetical protein n=1 Tax=Streptomyces chartreusis TaxID=1969 RepID=UPI003D8C40D3
MPFGYNRGLQVAPGESTPLRSALLCAEADRVPIPVWAAWMVELGMWAARLAEESATHLIAVSVPAREYVAVLAGCGAVYEAFFRQLDPASWKPQFERARSLPPGTLVRLVPVNGLASFVGLLGAAREDRSREVYEVGTSLFMADHYRIDVLGWPDDPSGFIGQDRVRDELDIPLGGQGLLPGPAVDFCGYSFLHCVLIGSRRAIEHEAETMVATSDTSEPLALRALLRPRAVRDQGRQYRSLIISAKEAPQDCRLRVTQRKPKVTVLDGASTVCRWLGAPISPVTLAVVERTAASSEAAADMLDRHRSRSAEDVPLPNDLAQPPGGIEVLAWRGRTGTG